MLSKIYFGGGCFWCTEAVFNRIKGVSQVVPGYMGGSTENPTYKDICTGTTGHVEVIAVHFDSKIISLEQLLLIFFKTHDPTTLNRQGNDVGTQYRSAIFYTDASQKESAQKIIKKLTSEKVFSNPIVTQVTAAPTFYKAEDYHHNYYTENPNQSYCTFVINPKIGKLEKEFFEYLKT